MKIIHTADWHIGKVLHRQDLVEEIQLFFDWLVSLIKEENIDILLVSGDVFDLANPSNRDVALYYQTLLRLSEMKIKVVITGGNHDSISLLEAPAGLLNTLNIHVIGGAKAELSEEIIPCFNADGSVGCIILAVPFLRDKDVRASLPADEMVERSKATEAGIKAHYQALYALCTSKYGENIPIIAMGHLLMKGAITSDSEREVHLGSLDGMSEAIIPKGIDYMALGHIHKPQKVQQLNHIRYSGSPIFLDFSERNYDKKVILIEFNNKKEIAITSKSVPTFRQMVRFSGSLAQVKNDVENFINSGSLKAFVELDVVEEHRKVLKIQELEDWKESYFSNQCTILKSQISFLDQANHPASLSSGDYHKSISELSPLDIFIQKMKESNIDDNISDTLTDAYMQLLEEMNN